MTTFAQNNEFLPIKNYASGSTLSSVVMSTMNRLGGYEPRKFRSLSQIAIECVKEELSVYDASTIEVMYATVNDAGIVQMPPDYIEYTKIGVELGGQLYNLTLNNNMLLNRGQVCGVDIREVNAGGLSVWAPTDGYYYAENFFGGTWRPALYGRGGGFNMAYYKEDRKLKRIQFDGAILNSQVVIEYKSTGIGPGTIIELELIPPIRTYLLWWNKEEDPRIAMGEKERKKEQYEEAIEKLRSYRNRFTLQEYLDSKYRSTYQGPKR